MTYTKTKPDDSSDNPNEEIRNGLDQARRGLDRAAHATLNQATAITLPVQVELAAIRQYMQVMERRLINIETYIEARRDQLGLRAEEPPQ